MYTILIDENISKPFQRWIDAWLRWCKSYKLLEDNGILAIQIQKHKALLISPFNFESLNEDKFKLFVC